MWCQNWSKLRENWETPWRYGVFHPSLGREGESWHFAMPSTLLRCRFTIRPKFRSNVRSWEIQVIWKMGPLPFWTCDKGTDPERSRGGAIFDDPLDLGASPAAGWRGLNSTWIGWSASFKITSPGLDHLGGGDCTMPRKQKSKDSLHIFANLKCPMSHQSRIPRPCSQKDQRVWIHLFLAGCNHERSNPRNTLHFTGCWWERPSRPQGHRWEGCYFSWGGAEGRLRGYLHTDLEWHGRVIWIYCVSFCLSSLAVLLWFYFRQALDMDVEHEEKSITNRARDFTKAPWSGRFCGLSGFQKIQPKATERSSSEPIAPKRPDQVDLIHFLTIWKLSDAETWVPDL